MLIPQICYQYWVHIYYGKRSEHIKGHSAPCVNGVTFLHQFQLHKTFAPRSFGKIGKALKNCLQIGDTSKSVQKQEKVFSPISPNSGIARNTSFLAALVCIGVFSICNLFIYICICYGSVNHTAFCKTKVSIQLHPSVIYAEDK